MRRAIVILCGILLASCANERGSSPFLSGLANGAAMVGEKSNVSHFKHLYSFTYTSGAFPEAGLLKVNDLLYGTTYSGGASNSGTVYTVTASGTESVVHSFGSSGSTDGANPVAGLIDVNGVLYGTTRYGGSSGLGTVFMITPSGYESLYSFKGGEDGEYAFGGLIAVDGVLYGTTQFGGSNGDGTVYTITLASGSEKVLYSLGGGNDGVDPTGALLDVNGLLYGTTFLGGTGNGGIVFSLTLSGIETVVHSFQGSSKTDGANPYPGLIDVQGTLYGTTQNGGAIGDGTVFSIEASGRERVLYSFIGGTDGANPAAALLDVRGKLYGTTSKDGGGPTDAGTVFAITKSGKETVLYDFADGTDGAAPAGNLIEVKGKLYGTTLHGGLGSGDGTVFSVLPCTKDCAN